MGGYAESVVGVFDFVVRRLRDRLDGLGEDEFLWEPVDGCWSLRQGTDGEWRLDRGDVDAPAPAPVTTIAWRLNHLAGEAIGSLSRRRFGDAGAPPGPSRYATRADEAVAYLDDHYLPWRRTLVSLDANGWEDELGEAWGPYAHDTTLDLALHVLDEVIHHAAEVALLRDLYARR